MALSARPLKYYRIFQISKGSGYRQIESPRVALKVIQSWFGHYLARALPAQEGVHGFVPSRSTISAAKQHLGAEWLWSFDIRDFFPSCQRLAVVAALVEAGYPESAAQILAGLTTIHGAAGTEGSPASPVLSNLMFALVDRKLKQLALDVGGQYTRYADDIGISGHGTATDGLDLTVATILEESGWNLKRPVKRLFCRKCLKQLRFWD